MTVNSVERSAALMPLQDSPPLTKSDSNASDRAQSVASHSSIPVIGAHPLGTLQVHQPNDSPKPQRRTNCSLSREVLMKPLPDDPPIAAGPPPLEGDVDEPEGTRAIVGNSGTGSSKSPADGVLGPDEDVVLILDLPPNFTVGYDSVSFTTRNSFLGVRDIPAGAHFFWASSSEASTVRSGFWIMAGGAASGRERIHVMQWDRFNEVLGEPASQTEVRIQRDSIAELYPRLAPFQYRASNAVLETRHHHRSRSSGSPDLQRNTSIWQRLSGSITPEVLSRVTGRRLGGGGSGGGAAWTVHTADRVRDAPVLASELALDESMAAAGGGSNNNSSRLLLVTGTELVFTFGQAVPMFDLEVRGAARTSQAVDATAHVLARMRQGSGRDGDGCVLTDDDVVGEMQFAFLVGMHLGNEACVQQWWHLASRVALGSFALATERPSLARSLLRALAAQLAYNERYLDGSVLDYGPDWAKKLRLAAVVYGRRLAEINSTRDEDGRGVAGAFGELADTVAAFGWDVRADYLRRGRVVLEDGEEVELEVDDLEAEDERGEYAAVVVDLDDDGRQRDLVSWE